MKLRDDPVERDIAELQKQADQLGEEGKLEEFNDMTKRIEELKQKKMQDQVSTLSPSTTRHLTSTLSLGTSHTRGRGWRGHCSTAHSVATTTKVARV